VLELISEEYSLQNSRWSCCAVPFTGAVYCTDYFQIALYYFSTVQ